MALITFQEVRQVAQQHWEKVAPRPEPGETQPQYAVRFHSVMQEKIPLTDYRNRLMLALWKKYGQQNPLIEHQVQQRFGGQSKRYKRVENVAEFTEHRTKHKGRDGEERPVIYDRRALEAVLNRCNERIADTGDFSPISDGHTPVEEGGKMPDVLGYAGPFYLGQIGNTNPRWAIFADEWHDQSEAARLEKLRRRSPEVWMEERMEDRFLDPVAALGAETPRLDMGWSGYSRTRDGRQVMKYSGPAVFPGQFNTSPAGGGKDKKQRYAPENAMDPQQGSNPQVEQVANMVMQMIMASDVWTALQEAVQDSPQSSFGDDEPEPAEEPQAEGTPPINDAPTPPPAAEPEPQTDEGDGPELDDAPEPDDDFSADDFNFSPADEGGDGAGDDFGGEPEPEMDAEPDFGGGDDDPDLGDIGGAGDDEITVDLDDDDVEQMRRYMAGECSEDEMKQYRAEKRWRKPRTKTRYQGEEQLPMTTQYSRDPATGKERYAKELRETRNELRTLKAKYAKTEKETAQLRKEVAEQRRNRTNAERYSRLMELAQTHAVDADAEYENCTVEAMPSDTAFEQHLATIERYADDIPVDSPRLHTDGDDGGRQNFQQAQKAKKERTQAIVQYARRHNISDWDMAVERYGKEHAS